MATIKPITWADGYFVSDDGMVYSAKRGGNLRPMKADGKGAYLVVGVQPNEIKPRPFAIHRLVAEAFVPNPNKMPHVNHLDGNKRNNKAENLEWVSPLQNFRHARSSGLFKSKLSDDDVRQIREMKKDGASHSTVAKLFGIDQSHVSLINSRKRYMWLA